MKKILTVIVLILLIFINSICMASSYNEAYESLKRLQISVDVGITYSDYMKQLRESTFQCKLYAASEEGTKNKEISDFMIYILSFYEKAATTWSYCKKVPGICRVGGIVCNSLATDLKCGEISKHCGDRPIVLYGTDGLPFFKLKDLLYCSWIDASEAISKLEIMHKEQQSKKDIK